MPTSGPTTTPKSQRRKAYGHHSLELWEEMRGPEQASANFCCQHENTCDQDGDPGDLGHK